jgi:beta-fructofuranosidase
VGETAGVGVGPGAGTPQATSTRSRSRGPDAGVSEKTSGVWTGVIDDGARLRTDAGGNAFPWSNAMLQWQRTGFHFQPQRNWMNDPNGTCVCVCPHCLFILILIPVQIHAD